MTNSQQQSIASKLQSRRSNLSQCNLSNSISSSMVRRATRCGLSLRWVILRDIPSARAKDIHLVPTTAKRRNKRITTSTREGLSRIWRSIHDIRRWIYPTLVCRPVEKWGTYKFEVAGSRWFYSSYYWVLLQLSFNKKQRFSRYTNTENCVLFWSWGRLICTPTKIRNFYGAEIFH